MAMSSMTVELGSEAAMVFCLVLLAWWVLFLLAEHFVADSAVNLAEHRPKPCRKDSAVCESLASAAKCDAEDVRHRSPSHKTGPVHKSERPQCMSEPAAIQQARAKLLEPDDGLDVQAQLQAPSRRREASSFEGDLFLSEPAAIQRARAKLLEPEDGLDVQAQLQAPSRRREASSSEGDLFLSMYGKGPRGVGRSAAAPTRTSSSATSAPTSRAVHLRQERRAGTPAGRQREAAVPVKISSGTRFLLDSIRRRPSI